MLKKLIIISAVFLSSWCHVHASERMYIDIDNLDYSKDYFHIQVGNNVWIQTDTVHRDETGLYTYESNIARTMLSKGLTAEYQKTWKCPYCYNYWPVGKPCGNSDCPSKYQAHKNI